MSRQTSPTNHTMLTRFRGEYAEAAIVNSAADLARQAERLRTGLSQLESDLDIPEDKVEYAGYGLIYFPEPTEELGFTDPETAKAIVNALRFAGLNIPDDPGEMDDYRIRADNCLDLMQKSDGYWTTPGLIDSAFLLAPVVREPGWGRDWDEFGQDPGMHVRHASGVRVPGIVILEGLLQYDPGLDEDRVPTEVMARYISKTVASTA